MTIERDEKEPIIPDVLGILPLRGTVILPHAVTPLAVGRPGSVRLIQDALQGSRILGAVMQRDPGAEDPRAHELHTIGTVILIHKALKQPDGTLRLVVQGISRFRISDVVQEAPFLRARIQRLTDEAPDRGDARGRSTGADGVRALPEGGRRCPRPCPTSS
jgi:ATP-dependent Lon protease